MTEASTVIPSRVDVDEDLTLVVRDQRTHRRTRGELVGAANELVSSFALTL